jgi:hypothetical protein
MRLLPVVMITVMLARLMLWRATQYWHMRVTRLLSLLYAVYGAAGTLVGAAGARHAPVSGDVQY